MAVETIKTYRGWNWLFFVFGMFMVWVTTHSGWAVFWTWVASIHLYSKIGEDSRGARLRSEAADFLRRASNISRGTDRRYSDAS